MKGKRHPYFSRSVTVPKMGFLTFAICHVIKIYFCHDNMHKMYPLWDLGGKYLLISSNLLCFTKYQFWVLNIVYLFNRSFIKFFWQVWLKRVWGLFIWNSLSLLSYFQGPIMLCSRTVDKALVIIHIFFFGLSSQLWYVGVDFKHDHEKRTLRSLKATFFPKVPYNNQWRKMRQCCCCHNR